MTGTDLATRPQPSPIPAKLAYARELANSGLLPAAYRKNPANVLYAVEYGDMLDLSPMAAITGIHIIDGKPTASAGLISGLVRKAKHRLRVTGDDQHAIAEITRCDDPKFVFRSEWTLERAKRAELLGKGNWKKYPAAMLKARAITEVARDACEEALFGLHYTAEELGAEVDEDGVVLGEFTDEPDHSPRVTAEAAPDGTPPAQRSNGTSGRTLTQQLMAEAFNLRTDAAAADVERRARAAAKKGDISLEQEHRIQDRVQRTRGRLRENAEPVDVEDLARQAAAGEEPQDPTPPAEPATTGRDTGSSTAPDADDPSEPAATTAQIGAIWTILTSVYKFGKDEKDQARAVCAHITGRPLESTKDMTFDEAANVLDTLASWRETAQQHDEPPRGFLIELLAEAQDTGGAP